MNKMKSNNIVSIILIALAACLIYAVSAGIRSNYGIMISAISENSGISYSSVSFVLAVAQLVFGIMQPIFGMAALKKSNSFVLCLGALMVASGLLIIPLCKTIWLLFLFLGILLPAGTGALSFGIIMGAITPVLGERKAATVSGIVSASSGLGNIVLSPVIQSLIESNGLWGAMIFLSIPTFILLPVSLWLSKSTSKDTSDSEQLAEKGTSLQEIFSEAIHNKTYLFLIIGFFTCGFHMAIIETHLYTQITTYGFSEKITAYAFSLYGITTMLGSVASGMLCNKFKMKWVLGTLYGFRCALIVAFLFLPKTLFTVYVFIALLGFTGNSTVPPTSGLVSRTFGAAKLAVLFGFVFIFHQIGSFFSAWLGGVCISATGGYTLIWCASALLSLLAATVSFCIKEN